ncbi:unnamed protein product, partial [Porites lobata]
LLPTDRSRSKSALENPNIEKSSGYDHISPNCCNMLRLGSNGIVDLNTKSYTMRVYNQACGSQSTKRRIDLLRR